MLQRVSSQVRCVLVSKVPKLTPKCWVKSTNQPLTGTIEYPKQVGYTQRTVQGFLENPENPNQQPKPTPNTIR